MYLHPKLFLYVPETDAPNWISTMDASITYRTIGKVFPIQSPASTLW